MRLQLVQDCKDKYAELYRERSKLDEKLDDLSERSGCYSCKRYCSGSVNLISERYQNCSSCRKNRKISILANQIDDLDKETNQFVSEVYSKAVFELYSALRPKLIRKSTGETIDWVDAFGNDFEKTTIAMRDSLIGLVEGTGRYIFANPQS